MHNSIGIILSIFLLTLSGIFSFAETCLILCNKNKIIRHAELKNKRAEIVLTLLKNKDRMISTITFGNTLINVLLASVTTNAFVNDFGERYIVLMSLGITSVILIAAEILPKNLALINPEKSSLAVAPLICLVIKIFHPITFVLQIMVSLFFRIFGLKPDKTKSSFVSDIKDLVLAYKSDKNFNVTHSLDMVSGISTIDVLKIGQAMVHRTNVMILNIDDYSIQSIVDRVVSTPYSRIPICDGVDNIIGVLHVKDLARYSFTDKDMSKDEFVSMLRKPFFAYENTTLGVQLNKFRAERKHIAIVLDEYSVFLGIITLEDIIEKIVGAIYDEHDDVEGVFESDNSQNNDGKLEVRGDLPIEDLVKNCGVKIQNHEEYTTVAGFIIEKLERIPKENETIRIEGCEFFITKVENNKIISVLVYRNSLKNE